MGQGQETFGGMGWNEIMGRGGWEKHPRELVGTGKFTQTGCIYFTVSLSNGDNDSHHDSQRSQLQPLQVPPTTTTFQFCFAGPFFC